MSHVTVSVHATKLWIQGSTASVAAHYFKNLKHKDSRQLGQSKQKQRIYQYKFTVRFDYVLCAFKHYRYLIVNNNRNIRHFLWQERFITH